MHDLLIIIISDLEQIVQIIENTPHNKKLKRFFVFIGPKPGSNDLNGITSDDLYLLLENAVQQTTDPYNMAIRAAILYSRANNFLFGTTNSIPNIGQIETTLHELRLNASQGQLNLIVKNNLICLSKEYLLFKGFEELYTEISKLTSTESKVDEFELAQALSGKPANEETIIAAIKEIVNLKFVSFPDGGVDDTSDSLIIKLQKISKSLTEENPHVIIHSDIISLERLEEERNKIPQDGAIIMCTAIPFETNLEFQKLESKDPKLFINIFTKN